MEDGGAPASPTSPDKVWGPPDDPLRQAVARPYRRLKRRLRLIRMAGVLVLLAAFVASGAAVGLQRLVEGWATHQAALVALYVVVLAAGAELMGLPLAYYGGFVVEHRFGLSTQTRGAWLNDVAKGFAVNLVLGLLAAEILFWLLRSAPAAWWLWAATAFIALAVVLANLAPVLILPLFFKFTPLEDETLEAQVLELCRKAGTRVRGVFRWGLSAKTKAANAALVGWGNTRRIILADTLLDGFEPDEVVGVFAHELGHHVYGHIWRGMALQAALTLAFFGLLALFIEPLARLQGLAGPAEVAVLPSILLLAFVLSAALLPLVCALSRFHERQADGYALASASRPEAYARAFERLCALNLGELEPPHWAQLIFGTHPAPAERIRRARAFAA
ncbi:MAG: M48 family metallopeptidase [bacterium]